MNSERASTDAVRRSAIVRIAVFACVLGAVVVIGKLLGWTLSANDVRGWSDRDRVLGYALFVLAGTALNSVFVPFPVIAAAGGFAFGLTPGVGLAMTVVVLAAILQHAAGRAALGGALQPILGRWAGSMERLITTHGVRTVIVTRLIPGVPYTVLNYCSGGTGLRRRDLALGTAIGAAPRTYAYVALGSTRLDLSRREAQIAVGLLALLAIGGAFGLRRARGKQTNTRDTGSAKPVGGASGSQRLPL